MNLMMRSLYYWTHFMSSWERFSDLNLLCNLVWMCSELLWLCLIVSGVRAEEAARGRVPPENGGALRMRPLHSQFSQGWFPRCSAERPHTQVVTAWLIWALCLCLDQYADPVADLLDQWGVFRTRLFRESCVFHRGNYVKDLSRLGRELSKVIIIDNSPASYIFHPENAVSRSAPLPFYTWNSHHSWSRSTLFFSLNRA